MPKVSILLPVFNGELYLRQAIESALNQTVGDFELLIADDASTDSSPEIIREYAKLDPRIHAWRNPTNLGLFANYNACLGRASAEYIKPFAQDDIFEPSIIEEMLSLLENDGLLALVSCARRWIDNRANEIGVRRWFNESKKMSSQTVLKDNLLDLKNHIGEPSSVMFRRAFAGSGFDANFHHLGDIEYWLRIIENGAYFYYNEALCRFRQHEGSTTTKNSSSLTFISDLARLGRKYSSFLEDLGVTQAAYMRLVAEGVSAHVRWLAKKNEVSLENFLAVKYETLDSIKDDFIVLKELAFNSFLIAGQMIEENNNMKTDWSVEYHRMMAAFSVERKQLQDNLTDLEERYVRLKTECQIAQHGHRLLESRCAELERMNAESNESCRRLNRDFEELRHTCERLDIDHKRFLDLEGEHQKLLGSYSWQLTKPLRDFNRLYRGARRSYTRVLELNKTNSLENNNAKN